MNFNKLEKTPEDAQKQAVGQWQYLRCERTDAKKITQATVGNEVIDGQNYHFYAENSSLSVHIESSFTDKPQFFENGLPFTDKFLWIFHKTYGIPLKGKLKSLFFDKGDYRRIRYCYWRLVRDLFTHPFVKRTDESYKAELLVFSTAESIWLSQTDKESRAAKDIYNKMIEVISTLEGAQLRYHIGDERIMRRQATVEGGKLQIGTQGYSAAVIPPCDCLGDIACSLLEVFKREGGKIIFVERVPEYLGGFETDRFAKIAEGCDTVSLNTLVDTILNSVKK